MTRSTHTPNRPRPRRGARRDLFDEVREGMAALAQEREGKRSLVNMHLGQHAPKGLPVRFAAKDLGHLSRLARQLGPRELAALSTMLHRRQPGLCELADWVGLDPRCAQARRFCIAFCGLALKKGESAARRRFDAFSEDALREVAGIMARGEETCLGKRGPGFRKRVLRCVVPRDFAEHDSAWLATTLSAFLFLAEHATSRSRAR